MWLSTLQILLISCAGGIVQGTPVYPPSPAIKLKLSQWSTNVFDFGKKLLHPFTPLTDATIHQPKLCDPTVQQYSGYIPVKEKRVFFWLIESRSSPSTDPLLIWFQGGPGCASTFGLLEEIGPCRVNSDGSNTTINPYSWNNISNVLIFDQPSGTGFSDSFPSQFTTQQATEYAYMFMQHFLSIFPQYRFLPIHLFGESFGGHYVPDYAYYFIKKNQELHERSSEHYLNVQSIGIGNGLTDPLTQYGLPWYKMACKSKYGRLLSEPSCQTMLEGIPECERLTMKCYQQNTIWACLKANIYCVVKFLGTYVESNLDPYDVRKQRQKDMFSDYKGLITLLNRKDVRLELGVSQYAKKWAPCDMLVTAMFTLAGDVMHSSVENVQALLQNGVRVLLYAGDADFIVNWYGVKEFALRMNWEHQVQFNSANDSSWYPTNEHGQPAGKLRQFGDLAFLQLYNGSHMAPRDLPQETFYMFEKWIHQRL